MSVLAPPAVPLDADTVEIMSWRREYPARAEQARELRRFVSYLLEGFPRLDDVVTAAMELFANALQHSDSRLPGGRIVLEVRRWPGCCVTLALTDQGGLTGPQVCALTQDAEHGRGLAILNAVTTCWGWHGDVRGRTVTAIFLG